MPNKRCRVLALVGIKALISSATPNFLIASLIDSLTRAAALPVGAANKIFKRCWSFASACNNCTKIANNLVNVVVLPVPGPPVIILNRARNAKTQATFCQSGC